MSVELTPRNLEQFVRFALHVTTPELLNIIFLSQGVRSSPILSVRGKNRELFIVDFVLSRNTTAAE